MFDLEKLFSGFPPDREKRLREIKRFSMFEVFFYRSSLWHHELRVFFITSELADIASKTIAGFDANKAKLIALVHDDAEIITGDVQLGHKQEMTKEQLTEVERNEELAIEEISKKFPQEIGGYPYKELLYHALRKDCVEAQLMSYADKLDAYGESLHEVFGGNISALRAVLTYTVLIKELRKNYSKLEPLFTNKELPLLNSELRIDPWKVHKESYAFLNRPHTPESVRKSTEFSFYNKWRELTLAGLGEEGVEILTTQAETF